MVERCCSEGGSGVPDQREPSGSILSFARVRGPKKLQSELGEPRAGRQSSPEKKGFFFFFLFTFFSFGFGVLLFFLWFWGLLFFLLVWGF
jgi:hypothetical protein